jgi:hypothetical protein
MNNFDLIFIIYIYFSCKILLNYIKLVVNCWYKVNRYIEP